MAKGFQALTRAQLRQAIGYNTNDLVLVTASTTGDTSSLIATYSFRKSGDDEYNTWQVYALTPVGSVAAGEKSWVSDYDGANRDATISPVFTAAVGKDSVFELWHILTVEEVNDAINQAISLISTRALQAKEIHTPFTESSKYQYDVLSNYVVVSMVEYVSSIGTEKTLHNCDGVWNESVDADVVASVDTTYKKQGSGSLKLVVAATASAADILATEDITSLDISGCSEVQIWIWSSVALAAGDIQLLLDNTASCVSPVESLDIPATSANTWTRHIISLANPYNDSAIISVGLKMVVDKGAFTLRVDDIKAIDANSNIYAELPQEYWSIAKAATPLLQLSKSGLTKTGDNIQLRVTGFQRASQMSADATTTTEIDPAWIIAKVTTQLLTSHPKSPLLEVPNRQGVLDYWSNEERRLLPTITTLIPGGARGVG